jgi:hypothetical protein
MATSTQRIAKSAELRSSEAKERHALLQRVLWSRQIKNSERIRDFLVYVCGRALQDANAEIHEQEIGCRVFGRKPNCPWGRGFQNHDHFPLNAQKF